MRRFIGIFTYLCAIIISVIIIGRFEMIINVSSLLLVSGVYLSGLILSEISIDKLIQAIKMRHASNEIIQEFRSVIKISSRAAMLIVVGINGNSLLFNYTGLTSIGEPLHGILTGLMYVVFVESSLLFMLVGCKTQEN